MTGPAGKNNLRPVLAGNRLHYAEREVLALQQESLFDVELQKAGHVPTHPAGWYLPRVQSERCQSGRERDPVVIFECQKFRIQAPNQRPAADKRKVIAHTFFF